MSFDELVADVLTNYAVAWQSSDGAECFGIAMELFNLIEQHVEAEMAWRDAEIERLRKANEELYRGVMRQAIRLAATEAARKFCGVGELERAGYIPAGSADEREAKP